MRELLRLASRGGLRFGDGFRRSGHGSWFSLRHRIFGGCNGVGRAFRKRQQAGHGGHADGRKEDYRNGSGDEQWMEAIRMHGVDLL
ncbi:MAG TPA: hypothetical protein VF943_08670, partial [Burkholderiales bacterium]